MIKRNEETINHPLPEWIDDTGKVWSNPQLAFMQKLGWIEYVVPIVPPTQAEIFAQAQAELTNTIQQHLDSVAQTRNYDGIHSLCTYATDPDPVFAAEGQAGVVLRSGCWRKGYEIMGAVVAGTWRVRTPEEIEAGFFPIPTAAELLAEMPLIGWI